MAKINNGDTGLVARTKINEAIDKVDGVTAITIASGTIDGVTLGTNSAITEAQIDNLNLDGNTISSTDTNGNINLTPDGSGEVNITKVDIDSGTIDGTVIGGTTPDTGAFTGLDLAAIAASKAVTAVDVFVYDTSKDSDGGAWRKRTQHTSWYQETLNTATRGARREFPAVAVLVLTASSLTIYDGDDPSLPMWMVVPTETLKWAGNGGDLTASAALNGSVTSGDTGNCAVILDFIADVRKPVYGTTGPFVFTFPSIADRDATGFSSNAAGVPRVVSNTVNDVAMTVLPDAPVDPATGLPVPTIAVATDGGVSVITDSGAVYDSASTVEFGQISFDLENTIFYMRDTSSYYLGMAVAGDYTAGDGFGDIVASAVVGAADFDLLGVRHQCATAFGTGIVASGGSGSGSLVLGIHKINKANLPNVLSAGITPTYNTGWMNGDIKGAFLSDTDDTDLVGSGELVTNGTFDTDTTGWTLTETGTGVAEWDSGTQSLKLTRDDLSNRGTASQTVSGTSGRLYLLTFDILAASNGNVAVNINGVTSSQFTPNQKVLHHFTSDGSDLIDFLPQTNGGTTVYIDNISVKLADADRSVNNKGLIVNGTVTRTAVATGADLVAYSGFSASNYLVQPYNSDLDFGTGDFCVMGWAKGTDNNATFVYRLGSSFSFAVEKVGAYVYAVAGAQSATNNVLYNDNLLHFYCAVRASGVLYLYVDGRPVASTASASSVTVSDATVRIGVRHDGTRDSSDIMALWRISATAPTAEQIKKIYEDEKFLFQENAQATLYGASDAVTALAHDPVTDLLHVGTSAGRSVFSGLRRVSNTTTAVGTAISASGGMIVEE